METGGIIRRPCVCALQSRRGSTLRPVHALWPAIHRRVAPGAPLFEAVNRRNFNRILKTVLGQLLVPEAARYSPHAVRRGTAHELKECGSHWSVVDSAWVWRPLASWGYLDMSRDVEIGAQQLFEVDLDSESEADPSYVHWGKEGKPHWPVFPDRLPMGSGVSRSPSGFLGSRMDIIFAREDNPGLDDRNSRPWQREIPYPPRPFDRLCTLEKKGGCIPFVRCSAIF